MTKPKDVVVIGGAGHVGLPLAIVLANSGLKTVIYDTSKWAVEKCLSGEMPFIEPGADELLVKNLENGNLTATVDPLVISEAKNVIVVIGTPVDEHLNPDPNALTNAIQDVAHFLDESQLIVLRSTIYPGVTNRVSNFLEQNGLKMDVAFCPERIAEHHAMEELKSLPQIVSGNSEVATNRAAELFSGIAASIVRMQPEEAEYAKLFTNTWRYIKFAVANQFFMMANDKRLDYSKILEGIKEDYPRAKDLPGAGFAAGPCLFKDTMQLTAASDNNFALGHAAMLVNEGLPLYLISKLEQKYDLGNKVVGILGMAFKGESDDIRSSLSYKLLRTLKFKAKEVIISDPYVTKEIEPNLISEKDVIANSDILIIAAPHNRYKSIVTEKVIVDVWNLLGNGTLV